MPRSSPTSRVHRIFALVPLAALILAGSVRVTQPQKPAPARPDRSHKSNPGPLTLRHADPTRVQAEAHAQYLPPASAPTLAPRNPDSADAEHFAPHGQDQPAADNSWLGAVPTESLVKKGDAVGYNNHTYGASFFNDRVDFATASPSPTPTPETPPPTELTLQFGGATVAGVAFGSTAAAEPQVFDAERRIDYLRGPLTERYLLQLDSLEQLFIIDSLPQRGEINVNVHVKSSGGQPTDGTVSNVLTFGAVETLGGAAAMSLTTTPLVTIEGALIIDGAGRKLSVPLAWNAGQYTITIPSDWVAAAALPITVDPLVGANLLIDGATGNTWGHCVAVAQNRTNDEWLVVWNEQVGASSFDWDVWARRVSWNGTILGSPIPIDVGATGAYEAHVAWSSNVNRYLVVWRGDPADNGTRADQAIYGRMLTGTGAFFGMTAVIGNGPLDDWNPRVAWGNNRFYVVWTAVISSSEWHTRGTFRSETNGFLANADLDLTVGARADYPDVAYANGDKRFLAVWTTRFVTGFAHVKARRVSATSMATLGAVFQVSTATSTSHAAVAGRTHGGSSRWVVVWDQLTTTTSADVVCRRVNGDGSMSSSLYTLGGTTTASWSTHGAWPGIAYDRDGVRFWYVVWHQYDPVYNSYSLRGRAVDTSGSGLILGATTDTIAAAGPGVDASYGAIAYDRDNDIFLAAYWDAYLPRKVRAQRFSVPNNPF